MIIGGLNFRGLWATAKFITKDVKNISHMLYFRGWQPTVEISENKFQVKNMCYTVIVWQTWKHYYVQ